MYDNHEKQIISALNRCRLLWLLRTNWDRGWLRSHISGGGLRECCWGLWGAVKERTKNMRRGSAAAGGEAKEGGREAGRLGEEEEEEVEEEEEEEGQRSSGHQHTDRSMPVMIAQSQPPPPLGRSCILLSLNPLPSVSLHPPSTHTRHTQHTTHTHPTSLLQPCSLA